MLFPNPKSESFTTVKTNAKANVEKFEKQESHQREN